MDYLNVVTRCGSIVDLTRRRRLLVCVLGMASAAGRVCACEGVGTPGGRRGAAGSEASESIGHAGSRRLISLCDIFRFELQLLGGIRTRPKCANNHEYA